MSVSALVMSIQAPMSCQLFFGSARNTGNWVAVESLVRASECLRLSVTMEGLNYKADQRITGLPAKYSVAFILRSFTGGESNLTLMAFVNFEGYHGKDFFQT